MPTQTTINESPKKNGLDGLSDAEWRILQKADAKNFELLKAIHDKGIKDVADFQNYIDALLATDEAEVSEAESEPIEIVRLDSVTAEKVDWFWPEYIPLGKIALLDGDPGNGKSLFTNDIAARATSGQPMPDGAPSIQGGVVLMSLEDGLADTIVPRLEIAGADKTKIIALQGVKNSEGKYRFPTVEDTGAIKRACEKINAKLVIIDPLMGYMGLSNSWKDQDVRRALSPLAKMADEIGVAVVIVRHLNKVNSNNSIYRGGGSIGIIGAARSALLIARDPENENRRILAGIKSNLAPLPPSLSYVIENIGGIPKIVWGGISSHTADALLAIPDSQEERSALEDAKAFLEEVLLDGAVDAMEIQRQAKQAGIADKTLRRAKKVMSIISKKAEFKGGWLWALPSEDGQKMPKVVIKKNGHIGGNLATFANSQPPEGEEFNLREGVI